MNAALRFIVLAALFALIRGDGPSRAASKNPIALSPDVATGIFIGTILVGILIFALTMLDGIQASDKIGQNKPELTR